MAGLGEELFDLWGSVSRKYYLYSFTSWDDEEPDFPLRAACYLMSWFMSQPEFWG